MPLGAARACLFSAKPAVGQGAYESTVLALLPISYWKLSEGTGPTALDSAGSRHGTYNGSPAFHQVALPENTSAANTAVHFNAAGHALVPSHSQFDVPEGAVSIWVEARVVAAQWFVSRDLNSGGTNNISIRGFSDGSLSYYHNGGSDQARSAANLYSANESFHLCASWGAGGQKLYKNGVLIAENTSHTVGWDTSNGDIRIGGTNTGGGVDADAVLDEVAIYGRQLSEAEVRQLAQFSYEDAITSRHPQIYLKLDESSGSTVADSSGNARNGTINGTPGAYNIALTSGTSTTNGGLDLGSGAWIEIPHASGDTAINATTRKVASATVSIWFSPNSLPSAQDKYVIVSKASSADFDFGRFEAWYDADGVVHVEAHTSWRKARISTPDGAVSAGVTAHLVVQVGYDGVKAWLDGAGFEDGYGNLLHVFGLGAKILETTYANTAPWRIGRAGWGGQADITVDEFAVFLSELTSDDARALAQSGAVAPLEHRVWGQRYVNESSYASIQAAMNDVESQGGGTVLIDPGSYPGDLTLRSNVRLKRNGSSGTVLLQGRVATATMTETAMTDDAGDLLEGDRTVDLTNALSPGQCIRFFGDDGIRMDRRWQSLETSNDGSCNDVEIFEIESCTSGSVSFVGNGAFYDFPAALRDGIKWFTPHEMIALEHLSVEDNGGEPLEFIHCKYVRLVDISSKALVGDDRPAVIRFNKSIYCTGRDIVVTGLTDPGARNYGWAPAFNSKEIVVKGVTSHTCRHGIACVTSPPEGPVTRPEAYEVTTHDSNNINSYDAHGPTAGGIFWNATLDQATGICGWRNHVRWITTGQGGNGGIVIWDGMGECVYEDIENDNVVNWFRVSSEQPSPNDDWIKNCVLRHIHHSNSPNGIVHNGRYENNIIDDVDTPPPE